MTPALLPDPLPVETAPEETGKTVVASAIPAMEDAPPPTLEVPPPAPKPTPVPAATAAPPAPSGLYVQVAALKDSAAARDLESELRTAGFETEILSRSDDGLIRIISGPYDKRDQAKAAARKMSGWGVQPFLREF